MHKQHFRGCWMPAEVFELIYERKIKSKKVTLLLIIDSLIDSKGKDCWASNKYLAEKIGVSTTRISHMITDLKRMGLLIQTKFNGRRRYLRTAWSRVVANRLGRVVANRLGSLNKEELINISLPHQRTDDGGHVSDKKKKNWKTHPRWIEYATKLYNAIDSVRAIPKTNQLWRWAEAISKIHYIDAQSPHHIRKVLKWYCKQIEKGDFIKDNSSFIPIAYSGVVFREKFERIEGAMHRIQSDSKPQSSYNYKVIREEDATSET